MRRHGVPDAYEKLKAISRGKRLDRKQLAAFVKALPIPAEAKKRLLALTPAKLHRPRRRARQAHLASRGKRSDAVRRDDLPVLVPAVPGAAADRAADPAVVRRQRRGVDHLHAVLPGAAARRLRLRALPRRQAARRRLQPLVHTRAARRRGGDCCRSRPAEAWKPAGGERADQPHPAAARRVGRAAVPPARLDQPAAAGLVRARAARAQTPTACSPSPTSPRCSRWSATRSWSSRSSPRGEQVRLLVLAVRGFAVLCAAVAWLHSRRSARRRRRSAGAAARPGSDSWLLARAVGHRLGAAARGHQPPHAERGVGAAAVARAAHALPAELHPHLRGARWYRPRCSVDAACWSGSAAWPGCWSTPTYHYDLPLQLGMFLPGLFLGCLFCHGELYRLRPGAARLTGVLPHGLGRRRARRPAGGGGRAAGLQRATTSSASALVALALLAALRFAALNLRRALRQPRRCCSASPAARSTTAFRHHQDVRVAARSFYGVLRVKEYGAPGERVAPAPPGARHDHARRAVPARRRCAAMLDHLLPARPRASAPPSPRGRSAAGARRRDRPGHRHASPPTAAPGDVYRFYEIDPRRGAHRAQASSPTSRTAPAKVEVALGDARLTLEREPPQRFDVLAVDAFSSDAIPVHLITREALARLPEARRRPTASSPSTSPTASSTWCRWWRASPRRTARTRCW